MATGASVSTIKWHDCTNAGDSLRYCQYFGCLTITILYASRTATKKKLEKVCKRATVSVNIGRNY